MIWREKLRQTVAALGGAMAVAIGLWAVTPPEWSEQILPAGDLQRVQISLAALLTVSGVAYLNYFFHLRDTERNKAALDRIEQHLAMQTDDRALLSQLRQRLKLLPDKAQKLTEFVGEYVVQRLEMMLTNEGFEVYGGFLFKRFYREMFEKLDGPCDVMATAHATKRYLWGASDLNELFLRFNERGNCSLTRIFILENKDMLELPETTQIMTGQHNAKVRVYWVDGSAIEHKRLIIADKQKTFSWQLEVDEKSGEPVLIRASWNSRTCDERLAYVEDLMPYATRFMPPQPNT